MKIFGKKSNVFVVVVVMAAFLAGCSNLWDYQPKNSNNKKPGNPTDQTPPPAGKIILPNGEELPLPSNLTPDANGDIPLEGLLEASGLADSGGKLADSEGHPGSGPLTEPGKMPAEKPKLDGIMVQKPDGTTEYFPLKPDGTLDTGGRDIMIPAGSTVRPVALSEESKMITFTVRVTGADGEVYKIPVEVPKDATKAKWSDIKAAADGLGIKLVPDGYTLSKINNVDFTGDPEFSKGNDITLTFTKEVSYSVNKGESKGSLPRDYSKTITYPADGLSLKDIFDLASVSPVTDAPKTSAPDGKDLASGWKVTLPDGTEIIVSSKQINEGTGKASGTFPAGTKIEPNWVTNADAATGGSDRTLTNLNTRGPNIGDGITGDGKIIPKDSVGQAVANGTEILGYIYDVDTGTKKVKVVAKEVQVIESAGSSPTMKHWAKSGKPAASTPFSTVENVQSGFDAWLKIVAAKPDAAYVNYQAIVYAVTYPRTTQQIIALGYPINQDPQKDKNYIIDNIVKGDGYKDRWYLPAVHELEMIYAAKDALLNWTEDRHKENHVGETGISNLQTFWSVNTMGSNQAKYVDFNDIVDGKPKVSNGNRGSDSHYILPVSEFKYEDDKVNH